MSRSMTGYGRATATTKKGSYVVEIQSVNRRFLESSIYLPKEYSSLEIDVRKEVSKKIFRGQIIVRLNFYPSEESISELIPDIKILKKLKTGWESIAKQLDLKENSIDINFLSHQLKTLPKIEKPKGTVSDKKEILQCVDSALDEILLMKRKEGDILLKDIRERLKDIQGLLLKIEDKAKTAPKDYENKLKERLEDFISSDSDIDERILKEIAIYSDKVDITEEIIRFNAHIVQFEQLKDVKGVLGRKMDFLLQEMTREVNTISSKSFANNMSVHIVEIKSELEKIREQAQNIE